MADSIGKSDDEVGRMLEVLRFWFTKDLVQQAPRSSHLNLLTQAEICQGQAVQALQLRAWRILQGEFLKVTVRSNDSSKMIV